VNFNDKRDNLPIIGAQRVMMVEILFCSGLLHSSVDRLSYLSVENGVSVNHVGTCSTKASIAI